MPKWVLWQTVKTAFLPGNALFSKIKNTFHDQIYIIIKKVYLLPLQNHYGQSYAYCINVYENIHHNTKGQGSDYFVIGSLVCPKFMLYI